MTLSSVALVWGALVVGALLAVAAWNLRLRRRGDYDRGEFIRTLVAMPLLWPVMLPVAAVVLACGWLGRLASGRSA